MRNFCKTGLLVLAIGLCMAGMAFAGGKGEGDTEEMRVLTFAHVFSTDHPVHIALLEANEMLKEKSNGRLERLSIRMGPMQIITMLCRPLLWGSWIWHPWTAQPSIFRNPEFF